MLKKILVLLVAMLTMGAVWAPSASAYEPDQGGIFNEPKPWGSQSARYRLMTHVDRAMDATPAGATMLISTYLLDRTTSVDKLISACRRGVSVRVILDEDIENGNSRRIIAALNGDNPGPNGEKPRTGRCGRDLPGARSFTGADVLESLQVPTDESATWGEDRSYAKKCNGSCRGKGGNMHTKFYAFSQTGTASNVVMVSSANLNRGGALNGWNDLFTMKNRPETYAVYNQIHREMTEDSQAGDGKVEVRDGIYTSRFFPMKDASKANDPTMDDLRKIGCHGANGRTKVNVSMFYWKGTRGNYIASKLLDLAREGCVVSIIYGAPSIDIATRLRDAARRNLISLYDSRWDFNNDDYNEVRTHAKYILVNGRYGGESQDWQVMTGSQNWVAGSLSRGDEVTLNIAAKAAYNAYINNWADIRRHSRKLPYNR